MSDERLTCPFCGGEVRIVVCNSVGTIREAEYENDPLSGLGFKLYHDETMTNGQDCPIAGYVGKGKGTLGMYIYDTREEAISHWNTRKPMERIVEKLEDTKGVAFLTLANTGDTMKDIVYDEVAAYLNTAIEIVKGGGVDETD